MSTIALEDALKKNNVTKCDSTDNVVLSYTDAATKKAGIRTVPASYLYEGSGSGINITYLTDYIKYVNIFNNLAEFSGSDELISYLSELTNITKSIAPDVMSAFNFKTPRNQDTDVTDFEAAEGLMNRLYLAGKAGKYIDLSNNLKYFNNYNNYLSNKSDIDDTYIGVVHGIAWLNDIDYWGNINSGCSSTYSMVQIAVGKLSEVFGNAKMYPITLYNTGYFINIFCFNNYEVMFRLSDQQPKLAYKLIDYMHSSSVAVS